MISSSCTKGATTTSHVTLTSPGGPGRERGVPVNLALLLGLADRVHTRALAPIGDQLEHIHEHLIDVNDVELLPIIRNPRLNPWYFSSFALVAIMSYMARTP